VTEQVTVVALPDESGKGACAPGTQSLPAGIEGVNVAEASRRVRLKIVGCKPRRVADGVLSVSKDQAGINRAALWPAVLADPPYGPGEAKHYKHAGDAYPDRTDLLRRCLSVVKPGGRVGFLDYMAPRPPKQDVRLVALVGVIVGFNNQARVFSVYEREDPTLGTMQRARALAAVRRRRE